jgi:hypothetical protein
MEDLLKAYMDQSELFWSKDNEIIGYDLNGHICKVRYRASANHNQEEDTISVWDLMSFLYQKQNQL